MTIRYVEFHQSQGNTQSIPDAVRIVGTETIIKIEIVPEGADYRHLLQSSDRLVGWLDVDLVMAQPRDVKGLKFDVIAIAKDLRVGIV